MRQNDEDFIRDTLLEKTGRDAYCKGIRLTHREGGDILSKTILLISKPNK